MPRKPRKTRLSRNDIAGIEIHRLWEGMEVVDATKDLRIFIEPCDVEGASPKEPANCVFARACYRQVGASKALFFRTVAYIDLPDNKGVRRVERFTLGPGMRQLIEDFDRGKGVIPAGGFELKRPVPSMSFAGKLNRSREARVADREKGKITGTTERRSRNGAGPYQDKPLVMDLVRSGTGSVHFAKKEKAKK